MSAHLVLAFETSCDETAVAIVNSERKILAQNIYSQIKEHQPFGGVVPEIAARAHLPMLSPLLKRTLSDANISSYNQFSAIAATAGPGLIGGVMVGLMMAKAIAASAKLPFIAINHLEGHALTARLTHAVEFPYLLLLASGGHCQLLAIEDIGRYHLLGETLDDAAGEAFDKVAKMLGLPYPGGPAIEIAAKNGDENRFALPRAMTEKTGCDFSFSGLKTAVRRTLETSSTAKDPQFIADICASFQACVADIFANRLQHALQIFADKYGRNPRVVLAGGVAANVNIGNRLHEIAAQQNAELFIPPKELCTDNAAMIAWAGIERFQLGLTDALNFPPKARWPLGN
jgi:N6-L-threonylcarbamoyladenine synthase